MKRLLTESEAEDEDERLRAVVAPLMTRDANLSREEATRFDCTSGTQGWNDKGKNNDHND